MNEGFFIKLFGGPVIDIFKKDFKQIFGPQFEENEIINKTYQAVERAYECFFKKHGKRFGDKNNSFLARENNLETLIHSIFPGSPEVTVQDLDPHGFHGAPQATPGELQLLIDVFKEEMARDFDLVHILADKQLYRKVDAIEKGIGKLDEKLDKTTQPEGKKEKESHVLLTGRPPRAVKFVGRDKELKEVAALLQQAGQVVLVNGLGGIGKTELCKRFFYDNEKEYDVIAWIDYTGSIKESFARQLSIPGVPATPDEPLDERFQKIMAYLSSLDEHSLILIDNIDNTQDEDMRKIFCLRSRVMASSRLKLTGFAHYDLDYLSPHACKELFYNFYQIEQDDGSLEKIIKLAGYHTLTVELLARTAQEAAHKLESFLQALQRGGFNLSGAIPERIETLWNNETARRTFFEHILKVFDISRLSEEEIDVLANLSLLPALYIDINKLCGWLGLPDKNLLNGLVRKGWLKQVGLQVFLHQVTAESIYYRTKPDCSKSRRLITSLANALYYEPGENPLEKAEYQPYAQAVLERLNDDDEELARLANQLSLLYLAMGQLERALEDQLKSLKIKEKILSHDHPSLATSHNNVAMIYQAMGSLDQALAYQLKALGIREKILSADHPSLATSYNNVATIYKDMGSLDQALAYQLKAMGIREKILSADHPHLASSYNNVALIYKAMGSLDQALAYQLKALAIDEKILSADHPDLAQSYNNVATIYQDMGSLDQALAYQLKALAIFEKILSADHPDLATSYHNLSIIYTELGRMKEALSYAQRAVAILKKLFPQGHPNLDMARQNLKRIKKRR